MKLFIILALDAATNILNWHQFAIQPMINLVALKITVEKVQYRYSIKTNFQDDIFFLIITN